MCTLDQGLRSYMEDDYFVAKDGTFAAVYDGHGGAAISKYLKQNLYAQVSMLYISSYTYRMRRGLKNIE